MLGGPQNDFKYYLNRLFKKNKMESEQTVTARWFAVKFIFHVQILEFFIKKIEKFFRFTKTIFVLGVAYEWLSAPFLVTL